MIELDAENVVDFLRGSGHLPPDVPATAQLLAWGVSNVVLRIEAADGREFVVKQSRGQLRTETPWFSRLDRIWREMDVMQVLAPRLPADMVPEVLFADRDNYWFAMQAVAADHRVWKAELLAGRADAGIAVTMGDCLARIHGGTAGDAELQQRWGDREVFVQLRVDPFYRHVARVHPELQRRLQQLIDEMFAIQACVVHADFSPKNILITDGGVTLVDYETAHYGDPAFDLGFFFSHLLLKTVKHASRPEPFLQLVGRFWERYLQSLREMPRADFADADFQRRCIAHLAGCLLSRIDGTSTIDYLPHPEQQDLVRTFCRDTLLAPPTELTAVCAEFKRRCAAL